VNGGTQIVGIPILPWASISSGGHHVSPDAPGSQPRLPRPASCPPENGRVTVRTIESGRAQDHGAVNAPSSTASSAARIRKPLSVGWSGRILLPCPAPDRSALIKEPSEHPLPRLSAQAGHGRRVITGLAGGHRSPGQRQRKGRTPWPRATAARQQTSRSAFSAVLTVTATDCPCSCNALARANPASRRPRYPSDTTCFVIPDLQKKNGHPMMTVESNEGNSRINRLPPTAGKSGAHAPNSWAYPSGSAVKKL
jgi:hypothetical protein